MVGHLSRWNAKLDWDQNFKKGLENISGGTEC